MIEITKERAQLAEDIRSAIALQESLAANAMHAQIRHLHGVSVKAMRLGLCVVESGATASDVAELADATDGDECPALAKMLDALAAEMDKTP